MPRPRRLIHACGCVVLVDLQRHGKTVDDARRAAGATVCRPCADGEPRRTQPMPLFDELATVRRHWWDRD